MKQLEGIVHPLVYSERRQWLQQHVDEGRQSILVLDIPLLYETDAAGNVRAPRLVPSLPLYRPVCAQAGRGPAYMPYLLYRLTASRSGCNLCRGGKAGDDDHLCLH